MDNYDVNNVTKISSGSYQRGDFYSDSDIRLDGRFEGNLFSEARVIIGEKAVLVGQLVCVSADIQGLVRGQVFAKDTLTFAASAQVEGDAHFSRFKAEIGAQFTGACYKITDEEYEEKLKEIHREESLF